MSTNNPKQQWTRIRTPNSGRIYFHNPVLDSTVWTIPNGHSVKDEITSIEEGVKKGMRRKSLERPTQTVSPNTESTTPNNRVDAKTLSTNAPVVHHQITESKTKNNGNNDIPKSTTAEKLSNNPMQKQLNIMNKKVSNTHKEDKKQSVSSAALIRSETHLNNIEDLEKKRRESSQLAAKNNKKTGLCSHLTIKNITPSVLVMSIIPVIFFIGYYFYFNRIHTLHGNERPTARICSEETGCKPNPIKVQLGLAYSAKNSYAAMNLTYTTTRDLRKRSGLQPPMLGGTTPFNDTITCQSDFETQTNRQTKDLCQGYCDGCVLGGDTRTYPWLPLIVAGGWSVVVVLSAIFIPIFAKLWQNKEGIVGQESGLTARDARVYLLLLAAFVVFAIMLFLIHHARVIDVPQGHAMYTFWIFYTCYFFGSSALYWSRLDVNPIKSRQPELSLGVAFLGYLIVTHIVGAYYLTGVQAWPCFISLSIAYIVNPAYFLSFIRRGLELWAVEKYHKKMLKKMKQEELKTLLANAEEEGEDGSFDPEAVAALTSIRLKMEKERKKKLKKQLKEQLKKKKKKQQKKRPKDNEKYDSRNPTTNDSVVLEMVQTQDVIPVLPKENSNNVKQNERGKRETKIIVKQHRKKLPSTELLEQELNAGCSNLNMELSDRLSSHSKRYSTIIKKEKVKKKNKLCDACCAGVLLSHLVRRSYWFIIFMGATVAVVQDSYDREVGEVGCIAREGAAAYLVAAGGATVIMIVTLLLLRKINDEHSIRSELSYVAVIAIAFMLPHVIMLYHAKNTMSAGKLGCVSSFFESRVGSQAFFGTYNLQACVLQLYANWLLLIMVLMIHTASISMPVMLTLQMGADKLREHSVISAYSYKGPQLLSRFETCVADPLCSKYFRRFLANEFTLDNMRFLVDIEDFKTTLIPTESSTGGSGVATIVGVGGVGGVGYAATPLPSTDASLGVPTFARACHTVNAWQTFSGNMPITLMSPSGRSNIKTGLRDLDIGEMIGRARDIVRAYFSNPYWCKLYTKQQINSTFRGLYTSLLDIQKKASKMRNTMERNDLLVEKIIKNSGKAAALQMIEDNDENLKIPFRRLLQNLSDSFEEVEHMIRKSLVTESYPKFINSEIGKSLVQVLEMSAKSRVEYIH